MTGLTQLLIGGTVGIIAWQIFKPKNGTPDPAETAQMQKDVIRAIETRPAVTPQKRPAVTFVKPATRPMTKRPASASLFTSPTKVASYKQVTSPIVQTGYVRR